MNLPKRTLYLIGFLAVITVVLLFLAFSNLGTTAIKQTDKITTAAPPVPPVAGAKTILTLLPNPVSASTGTLQLSIDTGTNHVTGVQIELSFDPTYISSLTLTPGTFFTNASPLMTKVSLPTGRATYALVLPPGSQGKMGNGIIANIQFHVKNLKQPTKIDILRNTIVTAQGNSHSVFKSGTGTTILP